VTLSRLFFLVVVALSENRKKGLVGMTDFFYLAVFCRRFGIPAERCCSAFLPNLLLVAVGANNGRLRVEQKNAKKDEKKLSENLELTILFVNLQRNK